MVLVISQDFQGHVGVNYYNLAQPFPSDRL